MLIIICDYCTLKMMSADAVKDKQVLTVRRGGLGSNLIHYPATIIPAGATIDHPNFVASLAHLTNKCECN